MVIKSARPPKLTIVVIVVVVITAIGIYKRNTQTEPQSTNTSQLEVLNTNISQELKNIPNNTVVHFAPKDSFIMPNNYIINSQIISKSILIYPQDQKNIQYNGTSSLESFGGIFITSANTVTSEEMFNETNQKKFDSYKQANPESDATSQTIKDSKGNDKFVITQTKPFKMIETILNRELIIEIISYEETDAYKQIVDTYSDSESISNSDHKAIYQLQKDLVIAYESQDAQKVFTLLSSAAQEKNSVEAIKEGMKENIFKDMISIEPTALIILNQNYVMQSRVLFADNFMTRVDISFRVDYDGERNNWSIESYVIKNKEKYLSTVEVE